MSKKLPGTKARDVRDSRRHAEWWLGKFGPLRDVSIPPPCKLSVARRESAAISTQTPIADALSSCVQIDGVDTADAPAQTETISSVTTTATQTETISSVTTTATQTETISSTCHDDCYTDRDNQ
jgi:hypothetical protein